MHVVLFEMLQLIPTILRQETQAKWVTAKRNEKSNVTDVVRWKSAQELWKN